MEARDLTVSYRTKTTINGVTFRLRPGALTGLVGPNGAGKFALVKTLLDLQRPDRGRILLDGRPRRDLCSIAYVPWRTGVDFAFPIPVHETALLGTFSRPSPVGRPRRSDHALELVDMADLRNRQIGHLSGGQAQRVFVARALA